MESRVKHFLDSFENIFQTSSESIIRRLVMHEQNKYAAPFMTDDSASEKARLRIREEMAKRDLSQRDLAGILGWSQSRVSKNLNARIELGLDDLAALCFAVGISLTEAVRDRGMEFCAEMTPTELRTLERMRALPADVKEAFLKLLAVPVNDTRRALPPKPLRKKGLP